MFRVQQVEVFHQLLRLFVPRSSADPNIAPDISIKPGDIKGLFQFTQRSGGLFDTDGNDAFVPKEARRVSLHDAEAD